MRARPRNITRTTTGRPARLTSEDVAGVCLIGAALAVVLAELIDPGSASGLIGRAVLTSLGLHP